MRKLSRAKVKNAIKAKVHLEDAISEVANKEELKGET